MSRAKLDFGGLVINGHPGIGRWRRLEDVPVGRWSAVLETLQESRFVCDATSRKLSRLVDRYLCPDPGNGITIIFVEEGVYQRPLSATPNFRLPSNTFILCDADVVPTFSPSSSYGGNPRRFWSRRRHRKPVDTANGSSRSAQRSSLCSFGRGKRLRTAGAFIRSSCRRADKATQAPALRQRRLA